MTKHARAWAAGSTRCSAADDAEPTASEALAQLPRRLPCSPASTSRARAWTRRRSPSSPIRSSAQGVIQPILVRPVGGRAATRSSPASGAGARRASRASSRCRWSCATCPTEAALGMALIENIQREDLNPLEEANGLKRLIDEFKLTHEEAAKRDRPLAQRRTNLLRLLELAPPVQEMLTDGKHRHGPRARAAGASTARAGRAARKSRGGAGCRCARPSGWCAGVCSGARAATRARRRAGTWRVSQEELSRTAGRDASAFEAGRRHGAALIRYASRSSRSLLEAAS